MRVHVRIDPDQAQRLAYGLRDPFPGADRARVIAA
jgi:hypothetical protein